MYKILNRNIKDVLQEFPALGEVLAKSNIGCTTCKLGSCLLKDIVDVHNLSEEQERVLMQQIGTIVFAGEKFEIPRIERKVKQKQNNAPLAPPLRELVEEHRVIIRFIAQLPGILEMLDLASEQDRRTIRAGVDFIRTYADAFHHAKEEKILFGFFDPRSEIIASFLAEHEIGRTHVRAVVDALVVGDRPGVQENLASYRALLTEHIKKEDEILYPWMNRTLSDSQVGQLFSRFAEVNHNYHEDALKQTAFVKYLEQQVCQK